MALIPLSSHRSRRRLDKMEIMTQIASVIRHVKQGRNDKNCFTNVVWTISGKTPEGDTHVWVIMFI
jgi:hypothetical protein